MALDAQFGIMGIVNVTPDSFSDGGKFFDPKKAITRVHELFEDGAEIVDIGAESTRPGAIEIPTAEEWRRLQPVLSAVLPEYSGKISIDTRHPEIIKKIMGYGFEFIINDVTTFHDPKMIGLAVEASCICVVSHLPFWAQGDIQRAHSAKEHLMDSLDQVKAELLERRDEMIVAGVRPENLILDPGIGFGKTMRLNWELVEFARSMPGLSIAIGTSNKRFIAHDRQTSKALYPEGDDLAKKRLQEDKGRNLVAARLVKESGARYLRVHNVKMYASLLS